MSSEDGGREDGEAAAWVCVEFLRRKGLALEEKRESEGLKVAWLAWLADSQGTHLNILKRTFLG